MAVDLAVLGVEATKAAPWAGILALAGIMWRSREPMKKIQEDSDKSLRSDLLKQMADQEKSHAAEIKALREQVQRYEDKIETQRNAYEAKLDYERVTHAGEMASMRHKVANLEQNLNMLLLLIETTPEQASASAKRIRENREKQEAQESAEKSAIAAAKITASSPNGTC